ncbi:Predicted signal-transduction protein containing cAMP-binding and CBS domains [Pseudoalteromonas luteoviolacea B = ATCC 29581]|nr:Predicted signal-transduction protein containing cAMP-binding and CBS domains [Pseudoalteromonas luteoviolacea B = ATCC 29581]
MSCEIQDIVQFVGALPPFNQLPASASEYFTNHLEIIYLSTENQHDWLQSNKPQLYLVRSGHFDLVNGKGELITRLASGDYFGYPSLLTGDAIQNRLSVQSAGIVYVLSQVDFDYLRREYKAFEQYFVRAHANRLLSSHYKQTSDSWTERRIAELMTRTAVTLEPEASIRDAAKAMSEARVSSIMITQSDKLIGVITDRDLRNRVLAAEVSPEESVLSVMTHKPKYIFENNRVFSALHLMLKHNIHHLPVLDEDRKPLGMITSTDLLRQQKSDPVQLIGRLYKAESVVLLKRLAAEIPDLLKSFSNNIDDISLMGKLLSGLSDALTSRLIQLFQEEFGNAPCDFAWICFGSQAREEQTLHSDQDNGLVLPNTITPEQRDYFARMGQYVCDHLHDCGIVHCPGNIMASNPECRGSAAQWQHRFAKWITEPTPGAMLNCKIYFDIRFIDGCRELYSEMMTGLAKISRNDLFYAAMATDINANTVPIGLFNQFKLEKTRTSNRYLDLKKRGVVIINDIARLYALRAGIARSNTLERLEALSKHSLISKKDLFDLKDCWRFLTQLRLRTQINQEGLPGNCINPEDLSSLEKHQLKEAFYLVKQAQQACAFKFARGSL